jgi:hypothetical protein
VEIPIALEHVRAFAGRRILEVGNVLSHYDPFPHTVIDKYERAPHVANVDVVEYRPAEPFDLVVSVSTLEHVGWDEEPREPDKILAAFDNLVRHCVKPGGRMVVTAPVGYNAFLDTAVASGAIAFTSKSYLRRLSRWVHWQACTADDVRGARFDHPYPFANALLVGVVDKPARGA